MAIGLVLASLVLIYLVIKLAEWTRDRRRLVTAIEKLPGPPNFSVLPLINHAATIVYIDALKHPLGTYVLVYHAMQNLHRVFPDTGLVRIWLAHKPVVVLYSPENVETILNSPTVINKAEEYRFFEPWIGEGLVTSKAVKWRFRRKILTPAFHFRILSDFLPIINQEASKLVEKLNQPKYQDKENPFDLTHVIALCTLDTICETAMGANVNSQANEQSPYVLALKEVGEQALNRVIRPWLWYDSIFHLTEGGRKFERAKNVMHDFSRKIILERKAEWLRTLNLDQKHKSNLDSDNLKATVVNSGTRNDQTSLQSLQHANDKIFESSSMSIDQLRASAFFASGNRRLAFLDLMLHQHLIDNTMSIDDIQEEVETFMFAGHDTTAMNISWTLYMLGLHQDIQDKVRAELDEVLQSDSTTDSTDDSSWPADVDHSSSSSQTAGNCVKELKIDDITNEQMRKMKYLERVIKESLRMWPSIPFVARQMTEDLMVDNQYLIPKGATCMILTHSLHNNPKYFPKPEVFDPDRFLPENSAGRHPFAYVPFSAGPRNCIGQKFAQMEVKVILAKVLRNYYVKTHTPVDKLALVGELVLRSTNGLNVSLIPRFT